MEDTAQQTESTDRPALSSRTRECHKCPRHGKGDPYCWQKCPGPADVSYKGISYVHTGGLAADAEFIESQRIDGINDPTDEYNGDSVSDDPGVECDKRLNADDFSDEDAILPSPSSRKVTVQLSEEVELALVPILANLMSLSDVQLCIFRHVFKGEDLKTIGSNLPSPISKQAVFAHLLRMCRSNKVVEKVIHGMMRKGHGGARRQETQLELFDLFDQ